MHAPVYAGLGSRVGRLPTLLQEMREYVRRRALLETVYTRPSHATQRHLKSTTRTARFLDEKYGADGKSKRRLDWKQSSLWHYWIEGCLENSSTCFRKFFRITHIRFDEIYLTVTDSGEFSLNPAEPLFARAFPGIPPGKHGAQLPKVCPLCLRIGASLRRLTTGEPYSSLETRFQISKTVLVDFCHKFLKWFLKYYYTMYVGGLSGVGFDTKAEIEEREWVFRTLDLSAFITSMDAVHMTYDRAPFPARHFFIGKEGYPTVGVNMHSNAVGWVKHVGSIFPDDHNDKTAVCFDNLRSVMRNDTLFTSCEWETSVPVRNGQTYNLHACMTLCDSGYHKWKETMCVLKYPTSVNDDRFSSRFGCSLFLSPSLSVYALFAFLLLCVGRQV
jgi:hypothetical protein